MIKLKDKLVVISFKIDIKTLYELDMIAERKELKRSELLREIILDFLGRERRKRELRLRVLRKRMKMKKG